MRIEVDYDTSLDPPGPIVPVTVEGPAGVQLLVRMLLDSGADCTLLPASIVRQLQLPAVDRVAIAGLGGAERSTTVHAARLTLGAARMLVRVVAFGREGILGRDMLQRAVTRLDGPRQRVIMSMPRRS